MENSSAVKRQRQHEHKQSCISAVFTFLCNCLGMRGVATADESSEQLRNLSELPMKCIKAILSFTTPRDVCRLAAVSTVFRSAANSDSVWNKFIPPQFYQIRSGAITFSLFSSKRELYFRLCDSILIDGGTKRFWLERSTGKIGYMLSSRAIWICHSENRQYWRWVSRDDSRFGALAKLENVCWLDIRGGFDCRLLSSDTEYRVVFRLKFTEDFHGWTGQSVNFQVITPEGEEIKSEQLWGKREGANDGWREVVAGEFTVRAGQDVQDDSSSMSFRMSEVTNWWKGGLLVDGVKIEPCVAPHGHEVELQRAPTRQEPERLLWGERRRCQNVAVRPVDLERAARRRWFDDLGAGPSHAPPVAAGVDSEDIRRRLEVVLQDALAGMWSRIQDEGILEQCVGVPLLWRVVVPRAAVAGPTMTGRLPLRQEGPVGGGPPPPEGGAGGGGPPPPEGGACGVSLEAP